MGTETPATFTRMVLNFLLVVTWSWLEYEDGIENEVDWETNLTADD